MISEKNTFCRSSNILCFILGSEAKLCSFMKKKIHHNCLIMTFYLPIQLENFQRFVNRLRRSNSYLCVLDSGLSEKEIPVCNPCNIVCKINTFNACHLQSSLNPIIFQYRADFKVNPLLFRGSHLHKKKGGVLMNSLKIQSLSLRLYNLNTIFM